MYSRLIIFFLTILICLSCNKDLVYNVDDVFVEYLNNFQSEANLRGQDYSEKLKKINVQLTTLTQNISGQCMKSGNVHSILIDHLIWNEYDHYSKEALLFHELGHCVLNRMHLDDKSINGNCNSLMRSSSSVCFMSYNELSREKYLNELFGL
ncbi:MAG: hypothetical protein ABI851_07295 [Saprospiraceae bacterium]